MRRDEMVHVNMSEEWFGGLIESLNLVKTRLENVTKDYPGQGWEENIKDNENIIDKIIKYGIYYESNSGEKRIGVDLYRSTAADLIWQLLLASMLFVTVPKDANHYENFKKLHDELEKNPSKKPTLQDVDESFGKETEWDFSNDLE